MEILVNCIFCFCVQTSIVILNMMYIKYNFESIYFNCFFDFSDKHTWKNLIHCWEFNSNRQFIQHCLYPFLCLRRFMFLVLLILLRMNIRIRRFGHILTNHIQQFPLMLHVIHLIRSYMIIHNNTNSEY